MALQAPTQLRAALGLPLFFGIGFVDSSMCGLCTESMVRILQTPWQASMLLLAIAIAQRWTVKCSLHK